MSDFMDPWKEDFNKILAKINEELGIVDGQMNNVSADVETQLKRLKAKFQEKIRSGAMKEDDIDAYRETLVQKRIESLQRARRRLLVLRGDVHAFIPSPVNDSDQLTDQAGG
ncbi:MAG: hypothetical protein AB1646_10605 [Thermodesulfobacteriota bacterium]